MIRMIRMKAGRMIRQAYWAGLRGIGWMGLGIVLATTLGLNVQVGGYLLLFGLLNLVAILAGIVLKDRWQDYQAARHAPRSVYPSSDAGYGHPQQLHINMASSDGLRVWQVYPSVPLMKPHLNTLRDAGCLLTDSEGRMVDHCIELQNTASQRRKQFRVVS